MFASDRVRLNGSDDALTIPVPSVDDPLDPGEIPGGGGINGPDEGTEEEEPGGETQVPGPAAGGEDGEPDPDYPGEGWEPGVDSTWERFEVVSGNQRVWLTCDPQDQDGALWGSPNLSDWFKLTHNVGARIRKVVSDGLGRMALIAGNGLWVCLDGWEQLKTSEGAGLTFTKVGADFSGFVDIDYGGSVFLAVGGNAVVAVSAGTGEAIAYEMPNTDMKFVRYADTTWILTCGGSQPVGPGTRILYTRVPLAAENWQEADFEFPTNLGPIDGRVDQEPIAAPDPDIFVFDWPGGNKLDYTLEDGVAINEAWVWPATALTATSFVEASITSEEAGLFVPNGAGLSSRAVSAGFVDPLMDDENRQWGRVEFSLEQQAGWNGSPPGSMAIETGFQTFTTGGDIPRPQLTDVYGYPFASDTAELRFEADPDGEFTTSLRAQLAGSADPRFLATVDGVKPGGTLSVLPLPKPSILGRTIANQQAGGAAWTTAQTLGKSQTSTRLRHIEDGVESAITVTLVGDVFETANTTPYVFFAANAVKENLFTYALQQTIGSDATSRGYLRIRLAFTGSRSGTLKMRGFFGRSISDSGGLANHSVLIAALGGGGSAWFERCDNTTNITLGNAATSGISPGVSGTATFAASSYTGTAAVNDPDLPILLQYRNITSIDFWLPCRRQPGNTSSIWGLRVQQLPLSVWTSKDAVGGNLTENGGHRITYAGSGYNYTADVPSDQTNLNATLTGSGGGDLDFEWDSTQTLAQAFPTATYNTTTIAGLNPGGFLARLTGDSGASVLTVAGITDASPTTLTLTAVDGEAIHAGGTVQMSFPDSWEMVLDAVRANGNTLIWPITINWTAGQHADLNLMPAGEAADRRISVPMTAVNGEGDPVFTPYWRASVQPRTVDSTFRAPSVRGVYRDIPLGDTNGFAFAYGSNRDVYTHFEMEENDMVLDHLGPIFTGGTLQADFVGSVFDFQNDVAIVVGATPVDALWHSMGAWTWAQFSTGLGRTMTADRAGYRYIFAGTLGAGYGIVKMQTINTTPPAPTKISFLPRAFCALEGAPIESTETVLETYTGLIEDGPDWAKHYEHIRVALVSPGDVFLEGGNRLMTARRTYARRT